jgi:hypothetical protein
VVAVVALRQKLRASKVYRQLEPHFDSAFYTTQYPDIAEAGIDPLTHYLQDGWSEGRDPSPEFSTQYYLTTNPDVMGKDINPFWHYLVTGKAEGRLPVAPVAPVAPPLTDRDGMKVAIQLAGFPQNFI